MELKTKNVFFGLILIIILIAILFGIYSMRSNTQSTDNYLNNCNRMKQTTQENFNPQNEIIENYLPTSNNPSGLTNKTLNVLYTDKYGNLASTVLIPSGTILMWTGVEPPPGWAICDGSNDTPDLRGRFILGTGQGAGLTNRIFNNKGGTETETLNINQVPWHNHTFTIGARNGTTSWNGNHNHTFTATAPGYRALDTDNERRCNFENVTRTTTNGGNHNHSFTVDYGTITSSGQGGGQSHNNMPPFYALCFIMKL